MFYVCIDHNRLAKGYYLICLILFFGGEGVAGLPGICALVNEGFAVRGCARMICCQIPDHLVKSNKNSENNPMEKTFFG